MVIAKKEELKKLGEKVPIGYPTHTLKAFINVRNTSK